MTGRTHIEMSTVELENRFVNLSAASYEKYLVGERREAIERELRYLIFELDSRLIETQTIAV